MECLMENVITTENDNSCGHFFWPLYAFNNLLPLNNCHSFYFRLVGSDRVQSAGDSS